MSVVRLLLVDDNPEFLHFARRFLTSQAQVEIVGEARSGNTAVVLARQLRPDVVLIDLSMPDGGGLEATRMLRDELRETRFIVLTVHDLEEYRRAALQAGADAFIVKADMFDELPKMLKGVIKGNVFEGEDDKHINCG